MTRKSRRSPRSWGLWLAVAVMASTLGCGASPIGGPDPVRSTYFKAALMDGGPLPYVFLYYPRDLVLTYFIDARLVPLDLGRTTDVRIFEDRGGSGSTGGNGRDTTVSTGRMTDIRVFGRNPDGSGAQADSVIVEVVRRGEFLYITRPHPDPAQQLTDTAYFENGVLVRPLRYWRYNTDVPTGRRLTYTTAR